MTKRTKQLIVLVLSIIMIAGSISYALWNRTLTQEGENRISAGCFDVSIDDKNDFIKLDDTYPMTDEMGMSLKPYTFTIKNTCDIDASFNIYLNVLNESTVNDENIKLQLNDDEPLLLTQYESNPNFDNEYKASYKIGYGKVESESYEGAGNGGEKEYEIRLWLKDMDTFEEVDHSFKAQVSVEVSPTVIGMIDMNKLGWLDRSNIEAIYTVLTNEVPNNAINSADVSAADNGSVMAWIVDEDDDAIYELYIGSPGGIFAPKDCRNLFESFTNIVYMDLSNFLSLIHI